MAFDGDHILGIMTAEHERPPLLSEPLGVDIVDGTIVLRGLLPGTFSLTSDAAIETAVRLLNAGVQLEI